MAFAIGAVLALLVEGLISCAMAAPQDVPHTLYEYTDNGDRKAVVLPLGRRVDYNFGTLSGVTTGRVESIDIKMYDGTTWTGWTAISGARWEPYGGLRGYQGNPYGTGTTFGVEWVLGQSSNDPVSGACPMGIPVGSSDYSGLTRGVWLSRGAWTAGVATSPLLQRLYVYSNRVISKQYSCYFNAVHPFAMESYQYTTPGNLTQVSSQGPLGGNPPRSWTYDARGNRLTQQTSYQVDPITLSTSPADQLTQFQMGPEAPVLGYDCDIDGRVTAIRQPNDSSGQASWQNQLVPAAQGATASGGLDSVYKSATVNGAVYSYYFDSQNRRRLKVYPTGDQDEFFYSSGNELLVDVGVDVLGAATSRPTDEYVWLGGRPVVVVRGLMSAAWARQSDSSAACGRNGESTACGPYFLVTDVINKPTAILDAAGKVSAIIETSTHGSVNTVPLFGFNSTNPYTANANTTLSGASLSLTTLQQVPAVHELRFNYGMVDTEGTSGAPVDALQPKAYSASSVFLGNLGNPVGGYHRGHVTGNWAEIPDGGTQVKLQFTSNANNCPPTGACSPATWPYSGVSTASYEYRRYEAGAQVFSTPLRFPGQYFDAETGLVENWNRFYEPPSGRYLSPEPLLQSPLYVRRMAQSGMSVPTYAYALNNPQKYVDPNGLGALDAIVSGFMWGTGLVWPGAHAGFRLADTYTGPQYILYVENHPFQPAGTTTTFGTTVCSSGAISPSVWKHETQHVKQAQAMSWLPFPFGEFYLPAHLASQGYSAVQGGGYDQYNPLETGPYGRQFTGQGHPGDGTAPTRPWPWW